MHRSEKTPGSKYSSTSGLCPRGHLERQAELHASTQDEADYIASFYHPIGVILIPSKLNVFYTSFVPGIDMISSKHLFFFFFPVTIYYGEDK